MFAFEQKREYSRTFFAKCGELTLGGYVVIGRNDECWCGSGKKWKKCHFPAMPDAETKKAFEDLAKKYLKQWGIILKTPEQIAGIREANLLTAKILDEVCACAKEGVTTEELDDIAHKKIVAAGAIPASLGYGTPPFPKSICTSLNDVVCHGIPDKRPLQKGDIVNIDVAVILRGYFGDCSKMVAIGQVTKDKKMVFDVALLCLREAISAIGPGVMLSKIGQTIQTVADAHHCGVVTQFVGHGVGIKYHEPPQVPHYANQMKIPLVPGMIFTIEPMINFGTPDLYIDREDNWTARTVDGKPSAQWEHTLLITSSGVEILTPWQETYCSMVEGGVL